MASQVDIKSFLDLSKTLKIIDVRSQIEFDAGHIPGAINIPVLNTEERSEVGKTYKREGKERAVLKGLALSGPHLKDRLAKGIKHLHNEEVLVHCWRGGMRSEFYAFLLSYYGAKPILLKGGYKEYRRLTHAAFSSLPNEVFILAGRTGSAKTLLLNELKERGEQIIDLEFLAKHRGSSFGALAFNEEPTQEQFENDLFESIRHLDPMRPVWIEDEGRTIGRKVIPEGIWLKMGIATRFFMERTFDERLDQIVRDYGNFDRADLKQAMQRIGKRLGPQHVKRAQEHLDEGEYREAFSIALNYYDKAYDYLLARHREDSITNLDVVGMEKEDVINKILETAYGKGKR